MTASEAEGRQPRRDTVAAAPSAAPSEQSSTASEAEGRLPRRDDEDAAAVLAVLALLSARSSATTAMTEPSPDRGLWGSPTWLLPAAAAPGPHAWWSSGLPR